MNDLHANVERFSGFAALYDENRPQPPEIITDILLQYLGKAPELVVDLGSGTGLSTFLWCGKANSIIGIEPNDDMRNQAQINASRKDLTDVSFIKADAYDTGLKGSSADIVTCSQSFHWMEPEKALKEVARILKEGGIFAAYDCDWPPVAGYRAESAYNSLLETARAKLKLVPNERKAIQYPKDNHLKNIRESGHFCYSTEIVFHNREACSQERFIGLALSQGAVQSVFKNNPEALEHEIKAFRQVVLDNWSQTEIIISYRMRLGVTANTPT
ncbi:MAG: class I SAM-dependent methyltransferase [Thermoclostridium sp.]|nr:class I SAM-dependent methyltransferase [Thermoclostridium sp.]